jgi:hypothetical protein
MNPTRLLDLTMRSWAKAAALVRAKSLTAIRRGVRAYRRGLSLPLVHTSQLVYILATGGVSLQAPTAGAAGIRSSPPTRA